MTARRSLAPLLVSVLVVALSAVLVVPAAAQTVPAPTFSGANRIATTPDFATDRYADPWDYSNAADILLDRGPTANLTSQRFEGGMLKFNAAKNGYVSLVFPGYHGALAIDREGQKIGVNASLYTHAAIRMYSSATAQMGTALFWDRCYRSYTDVCRGEYHWGLKPGWNTYIVPLRDAGVKGYRWEGNVSALRLAVAPKTATRFAIDWVRLVRPRGDLSVTWTNPAPGQQATLHWDNDTDPGNNSPSNQRWGPVALPNAQTGAYSGSARTATGTAATVTSRVPVTALPPGTYYFYAVAGGRRSAYSRGFTIQRTPVTQILDPDEAGGEDYATAKRRDPWDMNARGDLASWANLRSVVFANSRMSATNAGPVVNDPHVWLKLAGGIDTRRYHRLTVTYTYDGPFGLEDAPGGGMHGRLAWRRSDMGSRILESKELVTYAGRSTYTYDLKTNPASLVMETDRPYRHGWTGVVTGLRWDANEDRGARRWHLHDVKLRADDEARGFFDIRWRDNAYKPGATVSFYYDTNNSGWNGTLVKAGLAQKAGTNVHRWSTKGVKPGRYWIYAVSNDGIQTYRTYASGPVVVR